MDFTSKSWGLHYSRYFASGDRTLMSIQTEHDVIPSYWQKMKRRNLNPGLQAIRKPMDQRYLDEIKVLVEAERIRGENYRRNLIMKEREQQARIGDNAKSNTKISKDGAKINAYVKDKVDYHYIPGGIVMKNIEQQARTGRIDTRHSNVYKDRVKRNAYVKDAVDSHYGRGDIVMKYSEHGVRIGENTKSITNGAIYGANDDADMNDEDIEQQARVGYMAKINTTGGHYRDNFRDDDDDDAEDDCHYGLSMCRSN